MDEILYKEETISKIKDYLERDENIIFAYIFGSYATRAQRKQSDIDIALYFNKPPHGVDILKFVNKLSNLVAKEIHLVILNTASPFLKHQVMKYGKPLFIKDRTVHAEFRERLLTEYEEYKYISGLNVYD